MTISKQLFALLFVLSAIGFLDASYLTAEHYLGLVPPCTITTGCEQVTTSAYSIVAGIPVALLGAFFYLIVLAKVLWLWTEKKYEYLRHLAYFTWLGLFAAIYFTAVQAFILHAYCQYCLLSALTSTLIFLLAQYASAQQTQSVGTSGPHN